MRPVDALITCALPVSAVKYQYDLESLRSKGARDAGADEFLVLISWSDREVFLREVVGYTAWNKSPTLQRVLPLRHPLRPTLWCDEYELVDAGAYETRTDLHDPANNNAPALDWCRYLLKFVRPPFAVFSDAELANPALFGVPDINKEQHRYTESSDLPQPEMRIISGFGIEYLRPGGNPAVDADWEPVPDERQSIPTYKIQTSVTWMQIPLGAIPYDSILFCLNTVNDRPIKLTQGGRTWAPGTLGFKGLAKPIKKYVGADGGFYVDLDYSWTVRPGLGWNFWPARNAAGAIVYQPMRERASKADVFRSTNHQLLFTPG